MDQAKALGALEQELRQEVGELKKELQVASHPKSGRNHSPMAHSSKCSGGLKLNRLTRQNAIPWQISSLELN